MHSEILQEIGLTPNEAKIYEALLTLKEGSIAQITKKIEIDRRNAYDAIQRLLTKGLIFQVLPKKTLVFSPVNPDKLTELIDEKREDLMEIMPNLKKTYKQKNIEQSVVIYKGVGGLKNYINLILSEEKDIYGIGSKGTWFDPRIHSFAIRAGKVLEEKKIESHLIYDEEMQKYPEVMKIIKYPHKFLPKKYSSGSSIDIFGNYVAVYSGVNIKALDDDITIFITKDKTLAKDYKKWFDFMWDVLPSSQ